MPLHLDHRPQTLDEFLGNETMKGALKSVLGAPDLMQTYLFAGPRGCGKTTLAYIVARGLGCAEEDFHHLNLGNTRGIAQARELAANINFKPLGGPVSIYLLNECQNATSEFWECMLDPMEFTPKHVVFILCTTDPDKLKLPVISRFMRFDVKPLREQDIRHLLTSVLEKEGVKGFPKEVIQKISQNCNKIPREALILLNKVIDITDDQLALAAVDEVSTDEDMFRQLMDALLFKAPWKTVREILSKLQDKEPEVLRQSILTYCNKMLLNSENYQASLLIEAFEQPFYNSKHAGVTLACYRVVTHDA